MLVKVLFELTQSVGLEIVLYVTDLQRSVGWFALMNWIKEREEKLTLLIKNHQMIHV